MCVLVIFLYYRHHHHLHHQTANEQTNLLQELILVAKRKRGVGLGFQVKPEKSLNANVVPIKTAKVHTHITMTAHFHHLHFNGMKNALHWAQYITK